VTYRFPDRPVFYRRLGREFPCAVRGEGAWITDAEGRRYLDGSSGAMVAAIGHGVAEIADAVAAQMREVAYVSGLMFTNPAVEALADELADVLPPPLHYAYFLCSGSEAIEAAVKLARQYWCETGRATKWKVVSRVPSYHGNTLAALALSGREHYRALYGPLLTPFPRIAAPDPYRHPGCPACTGDALEQAIVEEGPETVAAFLFEPIVGSSGGAVVPDRSYVERVADICRRYDVLLMADEVLCGMGRTGRWFAFEHFGVTPDILVLGKGLTGGYAPLSAVVSRRDILERLARGTGYFNHAQTYSHTPVICAAGVATLRYMKRLNLVERARTLEPALFGALRPLTARRGVGDVRGKGLLAAVEFVADRDAKAPFARGDRIAERVAEQAFARGLIVWPNVGHVDGNRGDLVVVAPPLVATEGDLAEIGERLSASIDDVLDETGAARSSASGPQR
jgi:hypothetical protein